MKILMENWRGYLQEQEEEKETKHSPLRSKYMYEPVYKQDNKAKDNIPEYPSA